MTTCCPPHLKIWLNRLKAAYLHYSSIIPSRKGDTILLSSTMTALVFSSFYMSVFKTCDDNSELLIFVWMLNKRCHVSPPALKPADPVGSHTYTLLDFPVIFLIAVTNV